MADARIVSSSQTTSALPLTVQDMLAPRHPRMDSTRETDLEMQQQQHSTQSPNISQTNVSVYKYAVLPTTTTRWDCPPQTIVRSTQIAPGSIYMMKPPSALPEEWTMHIHIEGKPFYERKREGIDISEEEPCPLTILTDADPRNEATLEQLEQVYRQVQSSLVENNVVLPVKAALVITIYPEHHKWHGYGGYYLIDFTNQCVFWAEHLSTNDLGMPPVNAEVFADQHLKLHLHREFWFHVECYPLLETVTLEEEKLNVLETLNAWILDIETSDLSTSPYTAAQCSQFIALIESTPKERRCWSIARVAYLIVDRSSNYHGHPHARTSRTNAYEKVEESPKIAHNSKLFQFIGRLFLMWGHLPAIILQLCSVFLFHAPRTYLPAFENIVVDTYVYGHRYSQLRASLIEDWNHTTLLSTVLFAANMAFLAIPLDFVGGYDGESVMLDATRQALRTTTVTLALSSTMVAIGSIVTGLINIRSQRLTVGAISFLHACHHERHGYKILACVCAFPYGLLLWSVITFFGAILLFCWSTLNTTRYIMMGLSSVTLTLFIFIVWYFWKWEHVVASIEKED